MKVTRHDSYVDTEFSDSVVLVMFIGFPMVILTAMIILGIRVSNN